MNNDQKKELLKLTPSQKKAFLRLKRALRDFNNEGGVLVGNNDLQYALNGNNVANHFDYYEFRPHEVLVNAIRLDDVGADYISVNDPYIDASPYIVVG